MSNDDKGYHPVFIMFPSRIWNLPGITIQLLKFYEKIFQFLNKDCDCFVNNETLKEYTGMISDSSISAAFQFFEKNNELMRVMKNGKRYIVQPSRYIEDKTNEPVDKIENNSTNNSQGLATARGGSRYSEGGGLATARHNINKLNASNLIKSSCNSQDQKKIKSVDNPPANPEKAPTRHIDRNTMSEETRTAKRGSSEAEVEAMKSLPPSIRPKRYRDDINLSTIQIAEKKEGTDFYEGNNKEPIRHTLKT